MANASLLRCNHKSYSTKSNAKSLGLFLAGAGGNLRDSEEKNHKLDNLIKNKRGDISISKFCLFGGKYARG